MQAQCRQLQPLCVPGCNDGVMPRRQCFVTPLPVSQLLHFLLPPLLRQSLTLRSGGTNALFGDEHATVMKSRDLEQL